MIRAIHFFCAIAAFFLTAGGNKPSSEGTAEKSAWLMSNYPVARVDVSTSTGTLLESFEYTYDDLGRMASLTRTDCQRNRVLLKLDYTQVDYRADGPFSISEKGLVFDNILLSDRFGHHATLTGGVPWDHFNNLQTNIRIDLQNIMALNTTSKHNETFYGRAFANGTGTQVYLGWPIC